MLAKKSENYIKNAQKYSKNNGEGPNSIGLTVQKTTKMRPLLKIA